MAANIQKTHRTPGAAPKVVRQLDGYLLAEVKCGNQGDGQAPDAPNTGVPERVRICEQAAFVFERHAARPPHLAANSLTAKAISSEILSFCVHFASHFPHASHTSGLTRIEL